MQPGEFHERFRNTLVDLDEQVLHPARSGSKSGQELLFALHSMPDAKLDRLSRQLIWVHGAFIVLVIIGFGLLSTLFSTELAAHTPLARALCSFISLFWAARLFVQFAIFDAKPYLTSAMLRP